MGSLQCIEIKQEPNSSPRNTIIDSSSAVEAEIVRVVAVEGAMGDDVPASATVGFLAESAVLFATSELPVEVVSASKSCRVLSPMVYPKTSVVSGGSVMISAAFMVTLVLATPCFVSTQKHVGVARVVQSVHVVPI